MTDKEAKAFYNSSAWKQKRLQILNRDHYECQDCRRRIRDAVAARHSTDRKRQEDMESGRSSPYSGTEEASGAWIRG